jgi:hypothetical protein
MTPPPERRVPGWLLVLVLSAIIAAVAVVILQGPRR